MSDRDDILAVITEAAWIFDHKEWDRMGEIFTADAVAYGQSGLAAITANTVGYLGNCGPTQHLLGNHRVRFHGDSATATSYVRAFHLAGDGEPFGRAEPHQYWDFLGEYTDVLRRTRDGWRIASRRCRPIAGTGALQMGVR